MTVPYLQAPRWAHNALYGLRAGSYSALLVSGIGAVVLTPNIISNQLSTTLTDVWGAFAVLGGLLSLYGTLTERFRFELVGMPLVATAIFMYAFTLWTLTAEVATRLSQAAATTGLFLLILIRVVDLVLVAAKAKHERRQEIAKQRADSEG